MGRPQKGIKKITSRNWYQEVKDPDIWERVERCTSRSARTEDSDCSNLVIVCETTLLWLFVSEVTHPKSGYDLDLKTTKITQEISVTKR